VEEQATERTTTIRDMVQRIHTLNQKRESTLRGFSHDLRNPLAVIQAGVDYLKDHAGNLDEEGPELLRDLDDAVVSMKRMLAELMDVATQQKTFMQLVPTPIDVAQLTDRVRRRLRALVHGRDIRASVFSTREAPAEIVIDTLLVDRIVDNLLTNAAKYTERGSIVVELSGSPGFLVLKASDTGRGIEADEVERIFQAGGSDPRLRATDSYGVGLSVVLQLLDYIGGKLEVLSLPEKGTTFWVYLPERPRSDLSPRPPAAIGSLDLFSRVVKIRKLSA
jgi:signal transduction histidine kinase